MTLTDGLGVALYLALLFALAAPLGAWMARVFGEDAPLPALGPLERAVFGAAGAQGEQTWRTYGLAALTFNLLGVGAVFVLQLAQGALPANPRGFGAPTWHSALNTAVSFATNTNWQGYAGETSLSHLTQMLGLGVQNFLSAATGLAIAAAVARGFARRQTDRIGSFWVDVTRATVYVLLPLSFVLALFLVSQGVVQTFADHATATTVEGATQTIALGPAASQVAIKQLGTNGGGFFNANSAHPFEDPTPLTNLVEALALLVIPLATCRMFGRMVGDERQGRALAAAMTVIFVPLLVFTVWQEAQPNPHLAERGIVGGNLEGKEVRFGTGATALWAVATTAASNGSVNGMHDSLLPLGGLVPMWLIQLGEVVYGGVGSGLYGMVMFALVAVFVAGLMVGRTPEYLGKKAEAWDVQLAAIGILAPCALVLVGTAVSVTTDAGTATLFNPGPHGFSEVLYAWSSAANNNGSAFGGLGANTPFYNLGLGVAMLGGRFFPAFAALGIAGSMASKRAAPPSPGTLPTHAPLFVLLLVLVVIVVGALTFLPALALGPIVEHLTLR